MQRYILIILTLITVTLNASKYAIVVNKKSDISTLTLKQVKDIFLLKRHFMHDLKMIPVNIASTHSLRKIFEDEILDINREHLNQYWIKKHFHGISPPLIQSSDTSMKLFIKNVKGSIGYLPLSKIDKDLKVVYEF